MVSCISLHYVMQLGVIFELLTLYYAICVCFCTKSFQCVDVVSVCLRVVCIWLCCLWVHIDLLGCVLICVTCSQYYLHVDVVCACRLGPVLLLPCIPSSTGLKLCVMTGAGLTVSYQLDRVPVNETQLVWCVVTRDVCTVCGRKVASVFCCFH